MKEYIFLYREQRGQMINISQSALTRSQIKKFVLPYKTRENKKEEETEKAK